MGDSSIIAGRRDAESHCGGSVRILHDRGEVSIGVCSSPIAVRLLECPILTVLVLALALALVLVTTTNTDASTRTV